jgi:HAE1 family hydrophobic/amphiphilic exporter-1
LNAYVHRYDAILALYHEKLLPFALRHGTFVFFVCALLFANALLLAGGSSLLVPVNAAFIIGCAVVYAVAWVSRTFFARKRRGVFALGTHKPVAIATLVLPAIVCVAMLALGTISFDFLPNQQDGEISMTATYPPGTPIATTNRYVLKLEDAILKLDGVKSVSATIGTKPSGYGTSTGGNYAHMNASMQDNRIKDTNKTIAKIRKLAYLLPGGELQVAGDTGGGSDIFYALTGPEESLGPAAEKVAKYLRSIPGTVNVQTSAEVAAPRLNVDVDNQKCTLLGVSPSEVANVARIAVDGAVATKVRTPNGLVDVRVQFPQSSRNTIDALRTIRVRANDGTLIPLSSVATFTWTKAPTKIERLNRQRVINVLGDVMPGYSLGQVTGPLQKALSTPGFLPPGVGLTAQGNSQFMQETFTNMFIALVVSFMLVYMLMVILYGSFLEPLIVMFSVPMALVGALTFLALMARLQPEQGQSLNLISMLGIVMLFGLVAKNGILLVDYSNTLVKRGLRVREAVLEAAKTRFRPIVMTTAAMIFGMLPLALGYAEGGEWRQAMGTVIIGGLLSSLILTLFLVPMIYNTWMGYLERRGDKKAVQREMEPAVV